MPFDPQPREPGRPMAWMQRRIEADLIATLNGHFVPYTEDGVGRVVEAMQATLRKLSGDPEATVCPLRLEDGELYLETLAAYPPIRTITVEIKL